MTLRGNVGGFAGEYARDKISRALEVAHEPVLLRPRRPRLDATTRRVERRALAEVTVDVNGTPSARRRPRRR